MLRNKHTNNKLTQTDGIRPTCSERTLGLINKWITNIGHIVMWKDPAFTIQSNKNITHIVRTTNKKRQENNKKCIKQI